MQIFEARYLDMVKNCMRQNSGFGVVMIVEGEQVLRSSELQLPSISHYGTYCRIVDFDQQPNGLLLITIEGQSKFVVRDQFEQADRLMKATVEFLELEDPTPVPENHEHLVGLLGTLIEHEALKDRKFDIDFSEAREVGARLAELLPCPNRHKQRLLEMKDPVARLGEIEKLLERIQDVKEF